MSRATFQTVDRLIKALDDLLEQESVEARAGRGTRLCALQARISPILATLVSLAHESPARGFTFAVASLVGKRRENIRLMRKSLDEIQGRIHARADALQRTRAISPAYGSGPTVATRLNASR
jgi:hypothetical protein